MSARWFVALALAVFGCHLALAAALPPLDDELYYWCWSRDLQESYYDHPLMVALWVGASTALFGDGVLAMRLPACLGALAVLLALGHLTRYSRVLLLLLLTPVLSLGAVLITPDAPLFLFWTAYLLWLAGLHRRLSESPDARAGAGYWALGGVALGLGILSKYSMGLVLPAMGLSLLCCARRRQWLAGLPLHLAVAALVTTPILMYNARRDFAPLLYQWTHAMQGHTSPLRSFPEFLGSQILLVGLLPFALAPWAWRNRRELWADPRLRACWFLFAVPFAFFVFKALRGRLEANWPLVSYIALWPLAATWLAADRRRWRAAVACCALPVAVTLLGAAHLTRPFDAVPPKKDRLTRMGSVHQFAREVAARTAAEGPGLPVWVTTYQLAAQLRYWGAPAEQVRGVGRPSHFTQTPREVTADREFWFLCDRPLAPELAAGYELSREPELFHLHVRGAAEGYQWLWRYRRVTE